MYEEKARTYYGVPESICFRCRNAVPNTVNGCSWSRDGEPVDGWYTWYDKEGDEKYRNRVIYCPEFKYDEGDQTCDGEVKNFRALGTAIVTYAVQDYRKAIMRWLMNEERYLWLIEQRRYYEYMDSYVKELRKRYRHKGFIWEENDPLVLVEKTWQRISDDYDMVMEDSKKAIRCRDTIQDCESFFDSEQMLTYTEISGDYIKRCVRKDVTEKIKSGYYARRKKCGRRKKERND